MHGEKVAFRVERQFRLHVEIARLTIAEEGLGAARDEFRRAPQTARGPGGEHELGIGGVARAEAAANVGGRLDPHLFNGRVEADRDFVAQA